MHDLKNYLSKKGIAFQLSDPKCDPPSMPLLRLLIFYVTFFVPCTMATHAQGNTG